jgi:serine/threonine-protein kinase
METIEALGKYEIRRTLGRGAMGIVYEGWDPIIARRVAIKTVKLPDAADPETEDALARFRREAQAAGRLTHPNIIAVYDYGETSDLAYIVMEYVDGPSLKTLLDKNERFALTDTIRVMQDLMAGLQFSHERGVVHRDIKPANVMLTSTGQAKIADFGIARIESSSMTQAGTLLGTPAYMSPEQFSAQVVDSRTDIYSSGVLLYQLLTGERPFEGGLSAIMHKVLTTEPPAPSQLTVTAPPSFDAVVRRAMAKRPDDRYPSANAFAEAIRVAFTTPAEPTGSEDETTMVAGAPPPSPPSATATVAPTVAVVPVVTTGRRTSKPFLAGAALAVLGVVGAGAWWLLSQQPSPPRPAIATTAVAPAHGVDTPPAMPNAAPSANQTPAPHPSDTGQQTTAPQAPTPALPASPPQPPAVTPPAASNVQPQPPVKVQPDTQQLALADLSALRRQIAEWASNRSCTLLGGEVSNSGTVILQGVAGHGSIDELRQGLASVVPPRQIDWQVTGVSRVFCAALNIIRPITPAFGASGGPRLGLQMAGGRTRLKDGDRITVDLTMPDFAGWVYVDYVAHDGVVGHIYPHAADKQQSVSADVPRLFKPGERATLSGPWVIGSPYGTDMIIAVAAAEPLFSQPRASLEEREDAYLRDLQAAIDALRERGGQVAGAAVTLEALP